MYSSIEEESRNEVIKQCYWPLFKLADLGIPFGIEVPVVTLEIINEIDPKWIKTLSTYIKREKVEFIGSGYSQIIGPLVPAKVNEWNQKLGLERYHKILGVSPKLALINEMAYSGGIVEHYSNAGYEGIIMEWNNPRSAHPEWENEWRYFPQKAVGTHGESISLIWADSIAFQKFQRFAHGENDQEEYQNFLQKHVADSNRFFPLYSNDVEIFDFRPGRYQTETEFEGYSEWHRIIDLFSQLKSMDWCELIFPSEVLDSINNINAGNELVLESPEQPIPVKKQEKYNINRWAITGLDDLAINTKCFQIYSAFKHDRNENPKDWEELCYLWSSDFRTHITPKRWENYNNRLIQFRNQYRLQPSKQLSKKKNKTTIPRFEFVESETKIDVKHDNYIATINKLKGMTIKSFTWSKISNESLIGTLEHGFYDDISLGADFYTGHAVIDRLGDHKIADLNPIKPIITTKNGQLLLDSIQKVNGIEFKNQIAFSNEGISFQKRIKIPKRSKMIIHPFHITFNPKAWDVNSLYFQTHNGGESLERFNLFDQQVHHKKYYSPLISSVHGLGNTEGKMVAADKNQKIIVQTEDVSDHIIPAIQFNSDESHTFLRLVYSAQELDETFVSNKSPMEILVKLKLIFEL